MRLRASLEPFTIDTNSESRSNLGSNRLDETEGNRSNDKSVFLSFCDQLRFGSGSSAYLILSLDTHQDPTIQLSLSLSPKLPQKPESVVRGSLQSIGHPLHCPSTSKT